MAEERMLNDEILLGLIKANSGGGGGGTTDYDDLSNKPQIGGVTLSGNKSASDLGLATTTDLAGKQDALTFDTAPTDGSTNPVESNGVYDALALKQNATDNNLTTTSKTVVGAVNELKSGLTNLDNEVNGDATTYPYADVITIPDAIPANLADCNVKIEPVQDLHGYDHPWVGGAGKNKAPLILADIKTVNTDGTWSGNTYTLNDVTFTVNTDSDGNVNGIIVNGTASATTVMFLYNVPSYFVVGTQYVLSGCFVGGSAETYKHDILRADAVLATEYGDGITVTADSTFISTNVRERIVVYSGITLTNAEFLPMVRLATETDATFAPYTNICPISGHTEASVETEGKNLFNKTAVSLNKTVRSSDGEEKTDNNYFCSDYIKITPNTTYYLNKVFGVNWANAGCLYDESKNFVSSFTIVGTTADSSGAYTVTSSNAKYMRINGSTSELDNVYVVVGDSATDYVPYVTPHTATITFGQTVFAGEADFNTGKVRVTHEIISLKDLSWTYLSQNTRFIAGISGAQSVDASTIADISCEIYKTVSWGDYGSANYDCICLANIGGTNYVGLKCLSCESVEDLLVVLDNYKMTYPLATPTTIQLTPQQIQLLKGQNTLTASTGQISVTVNGVSGAIGSVQEQVNEIAVSEDAIDARLDVVESKLSSYVIVRSYSHLCSLVETNASYEFDIEPDTINGYTALLAVYGANNKTSALLPFIISDATLSVGGKFTLGVRNTTTNDIANVNLIYYIVYVKS